MRYLQNYNSPPPEANFMALDAFDPTDSEWIDIIAAANDDSDVDHDACVRAIELASHGVSVSSAIDEDGIYFMIE